MKAHDDLGLWAKMLAEENGFLATELAEFAGNWRGQLEARNRLIEQLGEALGALYDESSGGVRLNKRSCDLSDEALAAYREWKEANDGHKG